jgi:hypothetical protein
MIKARSPFIAKFFDSPLMSRHQVQLNTILGSKHITTQNEKEALSTKFENNIESELSPKVQTVSPSDTTSFEKAE